MPPHPQQRPVHMEGEEEVKADAPVAASSGDDERKPHVVLACDYDGSAGMLFYALLLRLRAEQSAMERHPKQQDKSCSEYAAQTTSRAMLLLNPHYENILKSRDGRYRLPEAYSQIMQWFVDFLLDLKGHDVTLTSMSARSSELSERTNTGNNQTGVSSVVYREIIPFLRAMLGDGSHVSLRATLTEDILMGKSFGETANGIEPNAIFEKMVLALFLISSGKSKEVYNPILAEISSNFGVGGDEGKVAGANKIYDAVKRWRCESLGLLRKAEVDNKIPLILQKLYEQAFDGPNKETIFVAIDDLLNVGGDENDSDEDSYRCSLMYRQTYSFFRDNPDLIPKNITLRFMFLDIARGYDDMVGGAPELQAEFEGAGTQAAYFPDIKGTGDISFQSEQEFRNLMLAIYNADLGGWDNADKCSAEVRNLLSRKSELELQEVARVDVPPEVRGLKRYSVVNQHHAPIAGLSCSRSAFVSPHYATRTVSSFPCDLKLKCGVPVAKYSTAKKVAIATAFAIGVVGLGLLTAVTCGAGGVVCAGILGAMKALTAKMAIAGIGGKTACWHATWLGSYGLFGVTTAATIKPASRVLACKPRV